MFLQKLRWIYYLLKSRTYMVLTDNGAVVNIPLIDINSFENRMLLAAQTSSLHEFRTRLQELIREHEEAIALLDHRSGVQKFGTQGKKASSKNRVGVPKTTKTTKSR